MREIRPGRRIAERRPTYAPSGEPAMNERDLFIAALQIDDPAERTAYLDQACGGENESAKAP